MREYMQMLIWMMLFVIVIEMIFPDSTYRKYIKLILGCILVYTLISPLVKWMGNDGLSYDRYVKAYEARLSGEEGLVGYEDEVDRQTDALVEIETAHIKEAIEGEFQVSVQDVDLEYDETNRIPETIYLTIGEKQDSIIQIAPIHIGEKGDTVSGDEEKLKNRIKTCLYDFYNVQDCNIYITVQKN